jgi:hypothetical protein
MEKETPQQEPLTEEQVALLKPVFIFFCLLAVLAAWLMYYSFTRDGGLYVLWASVYFYMCNIATNIRYCIKWPFYTSDQE